MGLSDGRRKQRLVGSAVVRNTAWVSDASLPGQRMMESMGWSPGSGLGTLQQGMSTNLAVSMKLDTKGIGAQRHEREALQQGKSDAWIGAGGDLGSLFERLAQANGTPSGSDSASQAPPIKKTKVAETTEEESVRRRSVSRLAHRAKFRRAKQMVTTNAMSMNEIFGISSTNDGKVSTSALEEDRRRSDAETKPKNKSNEKKAKSKDKDKGKDKGKDKSSHKSKSPQSDKKSTKSNETSALKDPPSNLIISPGGQFVFQYLSNKLIRKRAEVAQKRGATGQWW